MMTTDEAQITVKLLLVYPWMRDIQHLLWLTSDNLGFIATWNLFFIASKCYNYGISVIFILGKMVENWPSLRL